MKKDVLLKVKAGCTLVVLVLAFFVTNIEPARAVPTEEVSSIPQILSDTKLTFKEKASKIFKTVGAKLVGTTIRNTLNRLALDAAKYVATSGEGQKPAYVVEDFGDYWKNVGDAAAGDFIDGLGESWGVDLCQPLDPNVQVKIGLGLVQTLAPDAPDCTLSNLVSNYSSSYEKFEAMKSGDYLKAVQTSFDPTAGELGGAFTLFGRTMEAGVKASDEEIAKNTITGGWLNTRNIAGKMIGTPNQAEHDLATAKNTQAQSLLTTTGDALVDASNTFLNQLAYEGFQRVLREMNKNKSTSQPLDTSKLKTSGFESLIQYGESVVSEKIASIIKPRFDVRSDFSILSDLSSCGDNPGPNNCVIDEKFSQAISEKLTIIEALNNGYLHADWLVSNEAKSDSSYTLRSASILRKYRIVSVGWEQAIAEAVKKDYKVTLQDLISCFDDLDDNTLFSDNFNKNDQSWCRGLVDPNWVLKAPLNSCAKQGFGSQITTSFITKDDTGASVLSISRADDYCADDQTCVKEKADGSCELYGYCNEEKRTWKFGSDSCEPVYNTCQTFTSVSDKQTASFLENTLDYSTCDANNSGCKQYSYNGSYITSTGKVNWDKNYSIFFNSKAVSCDAGNEACTKLLRGKPGWSNVNYVMDADFGLNNVGDTSAMTNWHWPIINGAGSIVNDAGKALFINGSNGVTLKSDNKTNLLPKNLAPISGWSYTLSAEIKINQGDSVKMTLGNNSVVATSTSWIPVFLTAANLNNLDFAITGYSSKNVASFSLRNLKLSPNNYYSGFSNYASVPVYEKLLPKYLEQTCYNDATSGSSDYTLKNDAPAVCSNFARKCNRNEVGCDLFTSVKDIFAVAAKANVNDYCDAACVGYDTYIAKASYFSNTSADNIIPDKTTVCTAENVGCSSFTNLDAVSQGGEGVEYFTKVRQCVKPDTATCGDFYSWDNAQLKVMSLKKNGADPFVVDATLDASCTKETYNLPISDPRYNADCREFYNKSGSITYHLISNTVSCSDNCRSYRLNEKNIDKTLNASSCVNSDAKNPNKYWDAAQSACYTCQNGGVWDSKQGACTYQAIPSEGTTCSAEEVGCREYNGNNGSNLKLIASYDFESDVNGFYALSGGTISQSLESTVKNGHSLSIAGSVAANVSGSIKKGSAYVAKFMAKSASATTLNLSLENSRGEMSLFNTDNNNSQGNLAIKGNNQWNIYEVNLRSVDHEVIEEILKIKVGANVLIDNLIIKEITDRYYLIKGSSQVPDICSYDMFDVYQGPNYNLGCAAYTDRANTTHNLRQFSELCQNSAVGCEQMIQTNNSSKYYGYNVNLNNSDRTASCLAGTPGCIQVSDAQAIYAVFDSSKQCNQADAGCTRFGNLKTVGNATTWVDTYKINLPDTYANETTSPLCQSGEVGCDTWTYGDGSASYFKTPGLNTCLFKNGYWYKSPVKRCDINSDSKIADNEKVGTVCLTDSDCGTKKCITDTNDYPCNTTYLKTIGLGGLNGRIATPDGAVGLCNAQSAGCSEYIDPVSKYVNNLIYNPSATVINGSAADGWKFNTQRISVQPNKLYILQVDGDDTATINKFSTTYDGEGGQVRILGADNKLSDLVSAATTTTSLIFNAGANSYLTVSRLSQSATISIKEAIINYQLDTNIDLKTCNGVVNTDAGCILFNARTQLGSSGLSKNIYNATLTKEKYAPVSCTSANCSNNANSVIKVSPDRICSRWLSCQTYSEDPITHERTCYKMGECDLLNEKNECGNFLALDEKNRDIKNSQNKNATGYSLLNNWYIGSMKEVGQNTDAHFNFESNSVNLTCRRDVDVASSTNLSAVKNSPCVFDKNINDSLVLNPNSAPTDYPAQGKGFLKVLNYYQISPLSNNSTISIYTNQDYYINYLVNTKGSSAKAKLLITDKSGKPVVPSFIDESNGWSRRVQKFRVNDTSKNTKQIDIKIYLTSTANDLTTGYVYYDDINIEPVLQTGTDSFVSKDCRLYPSEDSLSCLSVNNNVIKDGLYGYCLQYDKLNPSVCSMWYPVDQISPITRNSQSVLGYSGKFPLYYCAEANGDFTLVEKIKPFHTGAHPEPSGHNGNYDDFDSAIESVGCPSNLCIVEDTCYVSKSSFETTAAGGISCGSDNYRLAYFIKNDGDESEPHVYCVPNPDKIKIKSDVSKIANENESCTFNEAWVPYDGFQISKYNGEEAMREPVGPNVLDSVMVLENTKSTEDDLKYVANSDTDRVFRFSCNRLVQLVDNEGGNMAWSGRISRNSTFTSDTPDFFKVGSSNVLNLYGRNREDVPFGAAVLPSDYNFSVSEPLLLRNQYSKKLSETIFAGRPYGCSGDGCKRIGQCSLDPNVYCVYYPGDNDLNKKSCSSGGNGSCIILWTKDANTVTPEDVLNHNYLLGPSFSEAISNLNQIFVKKYSDLVYSGGGYVATTTPSSSPFIEASSMSGDSTHEVTEAYRIKKVFPYIVNEDFRLVNYPTPRYISGGTVSISNAGLYQLSFNSIIDKEQQPMKQIIIDWGDGIQVITNTDNKPETGMPHKFYHFYLQGNNRHLEIKVIDNWGAYKCSAMTGNGWGGICTSID